VALDKEMPKAFRRGWCFWREEFRQGILERVSGGEKRRGGQIQKSHDEREARRLIASGLRALEFGSDELEALPKGDARKIAIASMIERQTVVGNRAISGTPL
jgi:hypothetical protein